jgi:predicted transport protein
MPSVEDATRTQIANIERSTGRSLAEWVVLIRASGLGKHGEMVAWLKAEHGLGHGNANLLAIKARAADDAPADDASLIAAHYADDRAALRPLYDAVVGEVRAFGPDVELSPKKTYVSLRRRRQFGQVGPGGKDRLEIGLNLDLPVAGRVERASGMVPRRVRIRSREELDAELIGWLRQAYDEAG